MVAHIVLTLPCSLFLDHDDTDIPESGALTTRQSCASSHQTNILFNLNVYQGPLSTVQVYYNSSQGKQTTEELCRHVIV